MMPRVLITGAAGFIGMHTSIRFLKEGWDVVGLDNMNSYYSIQLKEDRLNEIIKVASQVDSCFTMFKKDLNSNVWSELMIFKFDSIIHLAAQAGVRYSIENPRAYLESNILGFQSVLEFVEKTKVKRFLYASSSSVYGKNTKQPFSEIEPCNDPESYYAATKKSNELMANAYHNTHQLSSIGMRFFTVYGPWGRPDMAPYLFTKAGFNNKPIRVFNYGMQKRDFTYIDDIVEGILLLATQEKFPNNATICNIGCGRPFGLLDFISIVEQNLEKEIKKEFVDAQKGDVESTYADVKRLNDFVGYKPQTDLKTGINKFVKWFKAYNG